MSKIFKPRDHSLFLKIFRGYISYVNSGLYFRKEYVEGRENVPENGTPLVVVSNHQNCLNDPLCVCLKLNDRRMNFLARANVFKVSLFNKALRAMGLLPAYRMGYEGLAEVSKNNETLDAAGDALTNGETVMLYPEGGHQDKRWLGQFKLGYLRIAFAAAEKMNFEHDVKILPSCNHYSNYFHARTDMMVKFGEPISLMPYYESYKAAPRKTMVEINKIVRNEIEQMMLHIEDLENYDQIDFLRENEYGKNYAEKIGLRHDHLPSRLKSDKRFVKHIQNLAGKYREEMNKVYEDIAELMTKYDELNVRDWLFEKNPSILGVSFYALGLFLTLPLFIISIIPTAPMFIIPKIFLKKLIKDQMFVSSFNIGVSVFVTVPICLIIPAVLLWIFAGFWWGVGYALLFPVFFLIAFNYIKHFKKFRGICSFVSIKNRPVIERLKVLRKSIYNRLDEMMNMISPASDMSI